MNPLFGRRSCSFSDRRLIIWSLHNSGRSNELIFFSLSRYQPKPRKIQTHPNSLNERRNHTERYHSLSIRFLSTLRPHLVGYEIWWIWPKWTLSPTATTLCLLCIGVVNGSPNSPHFLTSAAMSAAQQLLSCRVSEIVCI